MTKVQLLLLMLVHSQDYQDIPDVLVNANKCFMLVLTSLRFFLSLENSPSTDHCLQSQIWVEHFIYMF